MKRFIILSLIIAMAAGAAFAQLADGISVNGWGRGVFAPLVIVGKDKSEGEVVKGSDGKDVESTVFAGSGASWGAPQARVDFRIQGNSDYVGFVIASNGESGELGSHDLGAQIWAKPFANDWLKLNVGKFSEDILRGKIGNLDGGFSNFVLATQEEDAIFNRFGASTNNSTWLGCLNGFMLSSAPIEGLYIGWLLNGNIIYEYEDPYDSIGGMRGGTKALNAYRYMQIGAGYNIDGIGHIRAQYIGGWAGTVDTTTEKYGKTDGYGSYPSWALDDDGDPQSWATPLMQNHKLARIEAAFALTAVEGLLVDLGLKAWLPLEVKDSHKVTNGIGVSLGANFGMDAFAIAARIDSTFGSYARALKDDDSLNGMDLQFHIVPTFALDFATLGLSAGMKLHGKDKDGKGDAVDGSNWAQIGFGGFIQKGLGPGSVKAGVAYTTNRLGGIDPRSTKAEPKKGAYGSGVFSIPIILEYAFF